jgi:sec-independent protein translocase protein TatA
MVTLAFFLGGWEIVLISTVVLILFGAKRLPEIARGLGDGFRRFRDALDDEAHDAGRSIGGIHGKPAAQALTPDNQVAEFYDAEEFRREQAPHHRWKIFSARWWLGLIWRLVRSVLRRGR